MKVVYFTKLKLSAKSNLFRTDWQHFQKLTSAMRRATPTSTFWHTFCYFLTDIGVLKSKLRERLKFLRYKTCRQVQEERKHNLQTQVSDKRICLWTTACTCYGVAICWRVRIVGSFMCSNIKGSVFCTCWPSSKGEGIPGQRIPGENRSKIFFYLTSPCLWESVVWLYLLSSLLAPPSGPFHKTPPTDHDNW